MKTFVRGDRPGNARRRREAGTALAVAAILASSARIEAQRAPARTLAELTSTPEKTATLFLRSVRAIRWGIAAQFMADSALIRFHDVVTMMVRADTTGYVRTFLTGADAATYEHLTDREVFRRAMTALFDDMPGLMHAVYDHDDKVIGHVSESHDTAHVVYRTTPRISGGVSVVKVMQIVRTPDGWRVWWSDELEVVDVALRGIARRVRPPPGASADSRYRSDPPVGPGRSRDPRSRRASRAHIATTATCENPS